MCGIFALLNYMKYYYKTKKVEDWTIPESVQIAYRAGKGRGPEDSRLECYRRRDIILGFHRLAINGFGRASAGQPLGLLGCLLICNGEIYNWKKLADQAGVDCSSGSDCEIIIHLYRKYGIRETLQVLDGVFAFILLDYKLNEVYIARDTYGVRPLFMWVLSDDRRYREDDIYLFASEMKMAISDTGRKVDLRQFPPGQVTKMVYRRRRAASIGESGSLNGMNLVPVCRYIFSAPCGFPSSSIVSEDGVLDVIRESLIAAVKKRVVNTDREVACLLSGGLDSSLISALVCRELRKIGKPLHTWSIGMAGSEDLECAKLVADHIGSVHHSLELEEAEFLAAIDPVIYAIESNDTTTVRASVGNWLVCKYVREGSEAKVIFNGDGADEVCGGYLYFHYAPDPIAFDKECRRLLRDISFFDVLRSDRSISSHGLEARTPFLDRGFVQSYLSIPLAIRDHAHRDQCEKYLLRKAFEPTGLLPSKVLWRRKEAFSDGVSHSSRSWYEVIQESASKLISDVTPAQAEQIHYDRIYHKYYGQSLERHKHVMPYKWMPHFVDASDASARALDIYKKK